MATMQRIYNDCRGIGKNSWLPQISNATALSSTGEEGIHGCGCLEKSKKLNLLRKRWGKNTMTSSGDEDGDENCTILSYRTQIELPRTVLQ